MRNGARYERYKSLMEIGSSYKHISNEMGISLAAVTRYMGRHPELRELKKFYRSIGKSSYVKLNKKLCKSCNEVKGPEGFTKSRRDEKEYLSTECKKCYTQKVNPGSFNTEDKRYYIYSHLDSSGKCFYIGKGTNKRAWTKQARNEDWHSVADNGYSVKLIVNGINHRDAMRLEYDFIREVGIDNLTNRL